MFALALSASPAFAGESWIRVETPHFVVLAELGPAAAQSIAIELERARPSFRAALGAPSEERLIRVLVFSSRARFEPFLPEFEGRARSLPGYSLSGPQRDYILLASDAERPTVLLHEYAHLYLHERYGSLPVWLDEGLAEFLASARTSGREGWLGEIHPRYVERLRREKLLPLEVFFSVNRQSPLYGDRESPNVFYAQAWAMAHFLLLGDAAPRFQKLVELAGGLAQGLVAPRAIASVFRIPPDRLETAFESYVRLDSWQRLRLELPLAEAAPVGVAAALEPELAFCLADVFAQAQRYDEARPRFQRAAERYPDWAPFHEELGWLALWQDDHRAAEEHFARAIAARSRDAEVWFLHAKLRFEQREKEKAEERPDAPFLSALRNDLLGAIRLKPDHARAHGLLGFTFLITRVETDDAIAELARAIALDPVDATYRIHLAQAYLQKRDWSTARRVLEQARAVATEPGARASIEQMLDYISHAAPRE